MYLFVGADALMYYSSVNRLRTATADQPSVNDNSVTRLELSPSFGRYFTYNVGRYFLLLKIAQNSLLYGINFDRFIQIASFSTQISSAFFLFCGAQFWATFGH
jgi:hypothetical protein